MTKIASYENKEDILKIQEFHQAMEKYHSNFIYHKAGVAISIIIIALQILTLLTLLNHIPDSINFWGLLLTLINAYIATDFINGLAHMYMDNNTHYSTIIGPFIAAFHLHHKQPKYKKRHAIKVYFYESGTKFWLALYLLILVYCQHNIAIPFSVNFFLVFIGILSSFSEVSHYWAHNARKNQLLICFLQKCRILLPKNHHAFHHRFDNTHYAFLNGITNPVLNKISQHFYQGYKNYSDKHVLAYTGKQSLNR